MTRLSHGRLVPPSWLRMPRRSARLRLTALYGGLFLLSGFALVAITYALYERATAFKKPQLPRVPHTPAIEHFTLSPQQAPSPQLNRALSVLAQDEFQLSQAQNQLKRVAPQFVLPSQLTHDEHQLTQDQHQLAQAVHQLAQAVHQLAQAGSVEAAQRAADSHELLVNSGIALAIVAVLALMAGWLVAGRMLRPIRTITRTARRISSTSLNERLALEGADDEFKQLGDTLDDLFARLEAAFEAQRHFVANASHELRTPLTRERALVQVALGDPSTSEVWRSTGRELLASNREQETLIDALLTLASSEGGLEHREPIDLSVVAHSVLLERRDTDRLGLQIDTSAAPAPVDGDPRLLESLVANLVDNAITHNVDGGRVEISTGTKDGKALLAVTNTGAVILPTEIDRLFQPFQRLDPLRTHHRKGHGLGLSIVRAIATAHGAAITAQPLPGGGVSIEVVFPAPALPQRDVSGTTDGQRSPTSVTKRARRPLREIEPSSQPAPPER
jgi:signal transduction histidine kinase